MYKLILSDNGLKGYDFNLYNQDKTKLPLDRSADGDVVGESAEDPEDREGADFAGDTDPRT